MRRGLVLLLLLPLALTAVECRAETAAFCSDYAQHAVQQVQLMLTHPGCHKWPAFRWTPKAQDQYNACRISSATFLQHEQSERAQWLEACGAMVSPAAGGPADNTAPAVRAAPPSAAGTSASGTPVGGTPRRTALPLQMQVCTVEPVQGNPCGVWTLRGGQYDAFWQDVGVTAGVAVDHFGADGVSLTRVDYGHDSGTYYYRGRIGASGQSIEAGQVFDANGRLAGHFTATWTELAPPGTDSAPFEVDLERLPPVMHFCAVNCFTLERRGDHYEMTSNNGADTSFSSVWTFQQFAAGRTIFLHRRDVPDPAKSGGSKGYEAEYTGDLTPGGDSLMNVLLDGAPAPGISVAWGKALNTLPGSNAERSDRQAQAHLQDILRRQALLPTRPEMMSLCAGSCTSPDGDICDSYVASACQLLVWDRDAYEAVWPDNGRQRIKVDQWADATVKLHVTQDPTGSGATDDFAGTIAGNGAVYGTETDHNQGHTFHGDVSPTEQQVPFKAVAVPKDATPPVPCPPVASVALDARTISNNVWRARKAGDLSNAVCWDRFGAEHGFEDFYEGYAYDLLFGTDAVRPDYPQALKWAEKAGALNDRRGLMIAAQIYREGLGVPRSPGKARQYEARSYAILKDIERADAQRLDLPGLVNECESDWGLMADIGVDCYAILVASVPSILKPGFATSTDCSESPSGVRNSVQEREDCETNESISRDQNIDTRDAAKERALSICESYRNKTLSNGELFDYNKCAAVASIY